MHLQIKCAISFLLLSLLVLIPNVNAQSYIMHVNQNDGSSTAFTVGEVQKITFGFDPTDVETDRFSGILKTFSLLQNYPNPFSQSTTITLELPEPGTVEIRVYDLNGRLVGRIDEGQKPAGSYRFEWDASKSTPGTLASGVYFYRVRVGEKMLTKKMIYIK